MGKHTRKEKRVAKREAKKEAKHMLRKHVGHSRLTPLPVTKLAEVAAHCYGQTLPSAGVMDRGGELAAVPIRTVTAFDLAVAGSTRGVKICGSAYESYRISSTSDTNGVTVWGSSQSVTGYASLDAAYSHYCCTGVIVEGFYIGAHGSALEGALYIKAGANSAMPMDQVADSNSTPQCFNQLKGDPRTVVVPVGENFAVSAVPATMDGWSLAYDFTSNAPSNAAEFGSINIGITSSAADKYLIRVITYFDAIPKPSNNYVPRWVASPDMATDSVNQTVVDAAAKGESPVTGSSPGLMARARDIWGSIKDGFAYLEGQTGRTTGQLIMDGYAAATGSRRAAGGAGTASAAFVGGGPGVAAIHDVEAAVGHVDRPGAARASVVGPAFRGSTVPLVPKAASPTAKETAALRRDYDKLRSKVEALIARASGAPLPPTGGTGALEEGDGASREEPLAAVAGGAASSDEPSPDYPAPESGETDWRTEELAYAVAAAASMDVAREVARIERRNV